MKIVASKIFITTLSFAMLVACSQYRNTNTPLCDMNCQRAKIAPNHISKISDINFLRGGRDELKSLIDKGDDYSASSIAVPPYQMKDTINVLRCAAERFSKTHGYDGWKSENTSASEQYFSKRPADKTISGNIVVVMYKAPLPADIDKNGQKACDLVPQEAK